MEVWKACPELDSEMDVWGIPFPSVRTSVPTPASGLGIGGVATLDRGLDKNLRESISGFLATGPRDKGLDYRLM